MVKPGKGFNLLQSYRSISLLPILSKVVEKIVHRKIITIAKDENLILNHQFGFRKKHNIRTNSLYGARNYTIARRKKYCSAVVLDIEKAFDNLRR